MPAGGPDMRRTREASEEMLKEVMDLLWEKHKIGPPITNFGKNMFMGKFVEEREKLRAVLEQLIIIDICESW